MAWNGFPNRTIDTILKKQCLPLSDNEERLLLLKIDLSLFWSETKNTIPLLFLE